MAADADAGVACAYRCTTGRPGTARSPSGPCRHGTGRATSGHGPTVPGHYRAAGRGCGPWSGPWAIFPGRAARSARYLGPAHSPTSISQGSLTAYEKNMIQFHFKEKKHRITTEKAQNHNRRCKMSCLCNAASLKTFLGKPTLVGETLERKRVQPAQN